MRLTRVLQKVKPGEFRYWKRYVERQMRENSGVEVHNRLTGNRTMSRLKWYYSEDRPWSGEGIYKHKQAETHLRNILIEPIKKQSFFKGDIVEVLVGKDKGKRGVINKIVLERNWCFVEGLHCEYNLRNKTAYYPGMVQRKEKPLLMTGEVSLVDPSDSKATDIEWRYLDDGTEVRVSQRTGRIIHIPDVHLNTWDDFVDASKYVASKTKDTAVVDLEKVTFKPKLCTFEEDILEKHGIKEERKYKKKFWY